MGIPEVDRVFTLPNVLCSSIPARYEELHWRGVNHFKSELGDDTTINYHFVRGRADSIKSVKHLMSDLKLKYPGKTNEQVFNQWQDILTELDG